MFVSHYFWHFPITILYGLDHAYSLEIKCAEGDPKPAGCQRARMPESVWRNISTNISES